MSSASGIAEAAETARCVRRSSTRATARARCAPRISRALATSTDSIWSSESAALMASEEAASLWSWAARCRRVSACRFTSIVARKSSTKTDTLVRSTSGTTGVRM